MVKESTKQMNRTDKMIINEMAKAGRRTEQIIRDAGKKRRGVVNNIEFGCNLGTKRVKV